MKVTEHIKNAKQTLFSFEILPPLKGTSIQSIYDSLDPLMEFNPPFIDVTYHREEYVYKKRKDGLLERRALGVNSHLDGADQEEVYLTEIESI